MSFLVRIFFAILAVLGILLGTAFVSFRCGVTQGLKDAPRHFYSVDVARALNENPQFRHYVDSLYVSTYRAAFDSLMRTDRALSVISDWLVAHPDCAMSVNKPVPNVGRQEFENTFFMKH